MNITEQILHGVQIQDHLESIARLRLTIFKEYPYLYDGILESELEYLQHYASHEDATAIIASCGKDLAGAVTAIPLKDEAAELKAPFANASYQIDRIYYIGELLFYPDYRNKGLGTRLLSLIERHILARNDYDFLTCATVVRPDYHPLRHEGFVPIERFLQRSRFEKLSGVTTHFTWKETDSIRRDHEMQFWIKELRR